MAISLGMIAAQYGCELYGDPDVQVTNVATLAAADSEAISFLSNRAYTDQLNGTRAAAVILRSDHVEACPTAALVAADPYLVYTHVARALHPPPEVAPGIHGTASIANDSEVPESCQIDAGAVIGSGVILGERVCVGPNTVIDPGVRLGSDTRLLSGVVICHGVIIGERCLIHPGAVIGSDGFGNAREQTGAWIKIPQLGTVVVGDDVEIGANTTIDRGAIEDTVIADGVRLDNQIQVAHNVHIGEHTAVAALTGISGSTRIGARCMIGGQVGFSGHIQVVDDVVIAAGTGVVRSLMQPGMYGGGSNLVQKARDWRRNLIRLTQLDSMAKRISALEARTEKATSDD
jgi:UDP-3-O-[3-hydroxymyristoyl] glucosamine N-acyltransferase